MIHLDNRGRPANNEELAALFHEMNPGDQIKLYGPNKEVCRLANSLSRTHKRHRKTRLSTHVNGCGVTTVTCINAKKTIAIMFS